MTDQKAYYKKYYSEHKEAINARNRESNKRRYAENPEKAKAYRKMWYVKNKEHAKEYASRYRARKISCPCCGQVFTLKDVRHDANI